MSTLLTQISWSNNVKILSSTKSIEEKEFYIKMCIKNNYSARELDRQIASGYFYRYMLSDGKVNESLTEATGEEDYPNTRILDMYSLEFLDLPNNYSEKDLKKSIISNMKDFILKKECNKQNNKKVMMEKEAVAEPREQCKWILETYLKD